MIFRKADRKRRDFDAKEQMSIESIDDLHQQNGSIIDDPLNTPTVSNQELLGLFTTSCTSLSTLIPNSPSRYHTLMNSESGYCDVFKGNPFEGTKCAICIQNHFVAVNKTQIDPFLFTIQFGVDQKVPKAQLKITGYSNDLQGVKFNLPYTLLNGSNEYEMLGVELKVGGVDRVRLKAVVDVSYEIESEFATGRAFVSFELVACLPASEFCYDSLPVSQFVQLLEMSETRIKALQTLSKSKVEKGASENFQQTSDKIGVTTSVQQIEL